ncbi:hypothetical protein [Planctomycetes bacterium TBK1r]|uniref:Tetratricopeptide repeat protein n=1 Tax=Stieleria magnilauensis TaxID=2527963 RepID=A0ABX5Y099_9BACT|nr:Tetratricopeptide repeat protein [Planctomycetes bacterium TBK1r]
MAALPFSHGDVGRFAKTIIGATLFRAGLYEDALAQLTAADESQSLELNRAPREYHLYLLAMAHAKRGDSRKAQQYFDLCHHALKESLAAEIHDSADRTPQWVRRVTLTILREQASSLLNLTAGTASNASKQSPQQALPLYSRALSLREDAPLLWKLRAETYLQLDQPQRASSDLARLERLGQEAPLRRLNRLVGDGERDVQQFQLERAEYLLTELKDFDAAIEDCYWILRAKDAPIKAFQILIRAHRARGTVDQAVDDWRLRLGNTSRFFRLLDEVPTEDRSAFDSLIEEYNTDGFPE